MERRNGPQFAYHVNNIEGTVTDGKLYLTMAIIDEDKGSPDCADWNVTCVGALSGDNWTLMNMTFSGTVCGPGGGQPFSNTGILLLIDRSPL
jgi:hypothetical protein